MTVCSYCHHRNPPDSRFCGQCGRRLRAPTDRHDERKVVSVLFADLVGFTSRAEAMDVEDVQALLDPYYALVREQLEQRGGTVEKFIGDAVVAIFGVPVAHEDDPERAVRAGLAIRGEVAALNERHPELGLHVRMAITTGEALVAVDVSPDTGETFASGDVVNTAARLQSAAPVDGVLVGESTWRATRDAIDYEEAPSVVAKGKAEPVRCWRALRARSRLDEPRRGHDAAPLVGRVAERDLLLDAFAAATEQRSVRAVTLVGVPGVGKSRLVYEFGRHIDERPALVRWREGRCAPYGTGLAFSALGEMVKAEAGLLESHERDAASAKLVRAVATVIENRDEARWVERHLRPLVGLEADGGSPGEHRAEEFAAWRRFVERLALRRPTVLVFEDLHWADDALLDFVEHLVAWAARVPLLIVCTARPDLLDRRPDWSARTQTIPLGALSAAEIDELLDALLGRERLPDATRAGLRATAGGNPLYAQELVRMLVDRALLVERDGRWVLKHADELPVPDSVLGIIAARVDAVAREDRAVIQAAAVVGRAFWPGAIAGVAERDRTEVEDALRRLERRHLVVRRRESSLAADDEYVFEHALIREVAYRSIVRSRRAETHRRAAEWLRSLTGDRRDRADAIAHHYVTALENAEAARQPAGPLREAATTALIAAAERAGSLHAHGSAARLWRRALDVAADGDPRRPALLLAYGRALALADEPADEVLGEAARALVAAGDPAAAAEAESTRAWLHALAGRTAAACALDERALAHARFVPPSRRRALILTRAGAHMMFLRGRRDEATRLLRQAIDITRALDLREMEAEALQFIGMARLDAGDAGGVRDLEVALAVATELNSPVSLTCYGNLAEMRRDLGALDEAATLHVAGEEAAGRFGIPLQVRRFRVEQASDLYYRGDWNDALHRLDEYLDAVETGSPHRLAGEARVHRGRIRLARGDSEGALADAAAAVEYGRRSTAAFDLFPALAFQARASARLAPADAQEIASDLLDLLADGQPYWAAWALPDLAAGLVGAERRSQLAARLAAARPYTPWYDAVRATLAGDHARAAEFYADIGARPEEALARLHAADAALAAGDRPAAAAQLAAARGFLHRAGARVYLRDADALERALAAPLPLSTRAAAPSPRSAR